jgi:hypothetical protein
VRSLLTLTAAALLTAAIGASTASAGFVDFAAVSLALSESATALPGAETRAASNVGDHSARLNGKVNPHNRPTTYHFEWGRTSTYGSRTGDTAAGRGESGVSAVATISGLASGTVYHFRLVAKNDAGTVYGADQTFTTTGSTAPDEPGGLPGDPATPADPSSPADPGTTPGGGTSAPGGGTTPDGDPGTSTPGGGASTPGGGTSTPGGGTTDSGPGGQLDETNPIVIGGEPEKRKRFAIAPTAGRISVNPPGPTGFEPLVEGASVPIGSIVDAREGTAAITTELDTGRKQTGEFWGERFKVRQPEEEGGLTEVRVRDAVRTCDGKSISAKDKVVSARKKKRRRSGLWGRDRKGRWRTHGHGSQATTRGTIWFTDERCEGTYTKVVEGSVLVRDHFLKRNVIVKAGESYLARPHKKKRNVR